MFQLISLEKPVTGTVSGCLVTRERMNPFTAVQVSMCVFVSSCACVISAWGNQQTCTNLPQSDIVKFWISWLSVQKLSAHTDKVLSDSLLYKKPGHLIKLLLCVGALSILITEMIKEQYDILRNDLINFLAMCYMKRSIPLSCLYSWSLESELWGN